MLQLAAEKLDELPNVPLITEVTRKITGEQTALKLCSSSRQDHGTRPYVLPPGVPQERVRALRAAFDATMKDPDFLADTKKQDLEVRPVSGVDADTLIKDVYATPPEVVKLAIGLHERGAVSGHHPRRMHGAYVSQPTGRREPFAKGAGALLSGPPSSRTPVTPPMLSPVDADPTLSGARRRRASLWRHRSFVLFWCAPDLTTGAYQMLAVAVGWQIPDLHGNNPLDLGLVGWCNFSRW